ncbi:MAG: hypothetical protein ABI910_11125 [Gemmatimonadota bacterium]
MKVASIALVLSAGWLAGCSSEGVLAPVAPDAPSLAVALVGNPPPPRVLGNLIGSFSTGSPGVGAAQQFVFRSDAYYNRNLTTGMNFFEMASGAGSIRANAAGVVAAKGVVVLVDPGTGATLTVDLSQLVGYLGPIFVACPPGSSVNCFALSATFSGSLQPVSGPAVSVTGHFKYRWDT